MSVFKLLSSDYCHTSAFVATAGLTAVSFHVLPVDVAGAVALVSPVGAVFTQVHATCACKLYTY